MVYSGAMDKQKEIRLLRISYWWGIIADAVMAVLMLHPTLFAGFTNIEVELTADFDYGLRYGVPLMVGWTVLLFWADRNPLERKDILPLTLIIVAGYTIFEIYSIGIGYTALGKTIPVLIMQTAMSAMFIFSYMKARKVSP